MSVPKTLKVAFIHPDLGIGGAERLVVDAALGLQRLGHSVDIYTSHHDPAHCFEETRDGTLKIHHIRASFPRSIAGRFHIIMAHLRQAQLSMHILSQMALYDVFFVDQLTTCLPFLKYFGGKRVVFYCHFPDKLLAAGEFVDDPLLQPKKGFLRAIYRFPMDLFEERTTSLADVILVNSRFTARVFKTYFPSINITPSVVYPGIDMNSYSASAGEDVQLSSQRPTFLSLNRFERKKNAALAVQSFAIARKASLPPPSGPLRLVLAGGYDPRLQDNIETLNSLINLCTSLSLTFTILSTTVTSHTSTSQFPSNADVIFLLNFSTAQRTFLLHAPSTLALLYTPKNEHFGIGPVEGMACGLPVLACDSGGPVESIIDMIVDPQNGTGWLRPPDPDEWAKALGVIIHLSEQERKAVSIQAKKRAQDLFSLDTMASTLESQLKAAAAMGPINSSELVPWHTILFFSSMITVCWWFNNWSWLFFSLALYSTSRLRAPSSM